METAYSPKTAVNMHTVDRVASGIGGAFLLVYGTRRRSMLGRLMMAAGTEMLRRGITGHSYMYRALGLRTAPLGQGAASTSVPYELGVRVDASITIDRPREDVYAFWRDVENLPRIMRHLVSVTARDSRESHWVAEGPAGRRVEWDAEIHNEIRNELLAWRSLPGSGVDSAGSVQFREAADGRTEVRVELQYNPPTGFIGASIAKFLGNDPQKEIEEDLVRLKEHLESGASELDQAPVESLHV